MRQETPTPERPDDSGAEARPVVDRGRRGLLLNTNAAVTLLAVAAILMLVNYWILPRHLGDVKADLTAGKYYSLSAQSKNVVRSIKADNPVELIAFLPQDLYSQVNPDAGRSLELNKKRLEEYGRLSPNLIVTTLDPQVSKRAREVIQESEITNPPIPGCLIRFKNKPTAVESVSGLDESQVTRGLSKLLDDQGAKRKVYFLTGHGELPLANPASANPMEPTQGAITLAAMKQELEQLRYEVAELPRLTTGVPSDCTVLASIGPRSAFGPAEVTALRNYLQNNGRLLVALDVDGTSGLEPLLAEYGLDWSPSIVDDPQYSMAPDSHLFVSQTYGDHEIVKGLARYMAAFDKSGSFRRGTVPSGMDYFALVKSSPNAKATPEKPAGTAGAAAPAETKGPFDLVVAVGTQDAAPAADAAKPETKAAKRTRIVAVSAPSFMTFGGAGVANATIVNDSVNWLSDNSKDMGIKPKNPWDDESQRRIQMTSKLRNKVLVFTFLLPLLICIGLGIYVGLARARR